VLDFLAHTLTNRLLHAPTVALRQAALEGDHELARASEKLFPEVSGIGNGEPEIETPEDAAGSPAREAER
jgi:glutamyl-tRNA reductase